MTGKCYSSRRDGQGVDTSEPVHGEGRTTVRTMYLYFGKASKKRKKLDDTSQSEKDGQTRVHSKPTSLIRATGRRAVDAISIIEHPFSDPSVTLFKVATICDTVPDDPSGPNTTLPRAGKLKLDAITCQTGRQGGGRSRVRSSVCDEVIIRSTNWRVSRLLLCQ
ncbi:hypothetical protein LZ30DRAFT_150451 [Colletotrichum cereale]|nr:hypothetical protein LZ30DRAFT_150451 [Colletotrichum cereale]